MSQFVIANTTFQLIKNAFSRNHNVAHQCLRIKNLQDNEICELVRIWDKNVYGTQMAEIQLIVAKGMGEKIPSIYTAADGLSITYYRNNNKNGLVYLETKVQSDEQGLQNIFTLRDSNFLDGSFDDYAEVEGGIPALIVMSAWTEVSQDRGTVPSLLMKRVLQLIKLVHPDVEPVPVRRFAEFSIEVCKRWIESSEAKAAGVADRIIGECLSILGMFPDPLWYQSPVEAQIKRRLELNARHAELIAGGNEIDPEEIMRLADVAEFRDEAGSKLPPILGNQYTDLCKQYAAIQTNDVRSNIPYTIFEQLFQKDSTGLKLGDRVRTEVENVDPSRIKELDVADVVDGLNSKLQSDAERLVAMQPEEGLKPIIDLLTNRTRKAVERVAAPPATRFSNPIIQLVRMIRHLTTQSDGIRPAKIYIEWVGSDASDASARGLFAFLYGPTLKSLAEATRDVPGACELVVGSSLTEQIEAPCLAEEQDDEDGQNAQSHITWTNLALTISATDEAGNLIERLDRVEWEPKDHKYLALFWLLVSAHDSPAWSTIGELQINEAGATDDWLNAFIQRDQSLRVMEKGESSISAGISSTSDELISLRKQLHESLCRSGLLIEALNDFTDAWQGILEKVRIDHIPEGSRPKILEAVLSSDMLCFSFDDRRLMLPTQPLRIRWIASYLQRCLSLATSCMTGFAAFATGEGEQYLNWLEALSPHETPPIAMGRSGEILHARSEIAWFEDFASQTSVKADVSVDTYALASIAARILDYINAHPFKRDGLSLLVLLPSSDSMPAQLIELITKNQYTDLRISLTVAAPKSRWERIARLVEALPSEERKSGRGRLFPARDLAFLEYDQGSDISSVLDGYSFDISIVTHVLQESVMSQHNTEPPAFGRPGVFDPVLDRPIRLEPAGNGGAIAIVMRPRVPDMALETWGTLVVRANRSCPVSPSQPENTDFVELRVNFQDSARVFKALHYCSHWVITLERHISREQIESAEAGAPDVLSIEAGVGSNGLSTLIVSSHSGRALIEARLAKKLRKLILDKKDPRNERKFLDELAARVYEETRKLSPHLALQAMGVARVTEEILGLCIARRFSDERFPRSVANGFLAWISLDEHTSWFGGHANIRADMCRIIVERNADGYLDVYILVIEGKFRQSFDPHGATQVSKTKVFLSQILANATNDIAENVDAEMWRERFLSAIESVSEYALQVVNEGLLVKGEGARLIPEDIRQNFRQGKYRLKSLDGLYSICLWESNGPVSIEENELLTIIRSSRENVLDLISRPDKGISIGAYSKINLTEDIRITSLANEIASGTSPSESMGEIALIKHQDAIINLIKNSIAVESNELIVGKSDGVDSVEVSPKINLSNRGMSGKDLASMYDEVLACFASHNIPVLAALSKDQPIVEGPASILFKVRAGAGVDPRKLFEKAQSLKLRLELEQDQNISFDIDKGYVTIDVPKKPEHRYYVNAEDLWARWERPSNELSVPLGEDRYGELVIINFSSSNSPHLLVAGTTGSGKSEALNTMLFGLVRHYSPSELRLMLVDPKGTELISFERSPYLIGSIGWEDADALILLKNAVDEMQSRYEKFRQERCRSLAEFNALKDSDERLPWWLIVLDEYADLTHDAQAKKEIEQELKRLAQKARAAGIHVIIATQKPSADVISTNLRSNLPSQLALRVKSGTESRVVLDEAGAENLNGKGDGLLKADGKLRRVQCARVQVNT